MTEPVIIRLVGAQDIAVLHVINQAAVPGVGSVTREELTELLFELADHVIVAERDGVPVGFVLCMIEGVDYGSANYQWLSRYHVSFAYIDRVAVSEVMRGLGIGAKLYQAAFRHYDGRRPVLTAEVNLKPPNPGSLRFHQWLGFREVGQRWEPDRSKGVVYLERPLTPLL